MLLARAAFRVTGGLVVLVLASIVGASDIGQEITNKVSLTNYRHYLDDLLYTHAGDDRGSGRRICVVQPGEQSRLF